MGSARTAVHSELELSSTMADDECSTGGYACGGCTCAGLITMIVLLSISFQTLDQLDFGLNYNSIGETIEQEVYEQAGLYCLGVAHSFIRYPKTIQTIEFISEDNDRLQTRTSDGLPVKLSISFQWRYDPGQLLKNYQTYRGGERYVYENVAKATIANVATNFSAYTFFNDKQGIATSMQIQISRVFSETLFATIDAFQITRVELPVEFQNAILDTIQAKQNITAKTRYKENVEVTRQTVLAEMYAYGNLTQAVATGFGAPMNSTRRSTTYGGMSSSSRRHAATRTTRTSWSESTRRCCSAPPEGSMCKVHASTMSVERGPSAGMVHGRHSRSKQTAKQGDKQPRLRLGRERAGICAWMS